MGSPIALLLLLAAVPDVSVHGTTLHVDGRRVEMPGHVLAIAPNREHPIAAVFVMRSPPSEEDRAAGVMASDALWLVDLVSGRKRRVPLGEMGPSSWNEAFWSPDGRWGAQPASNYGPMLVFEAAQVQSWIRRGGPLTKVAAPKAAVARVVELKSWQPSGEANVELTCCGSTRRYVLDPERRELRPAR